MQHRDVVLWLLVPADKNPSESIHPAMSALHNPAAGPGARVTLQCFHLLATRADVSGEAKLLHNRAHLVIVIAFVHAHALRLVRRWLGPFDGYVLQSLLNQLHVVAIGSVPGDAHRYAGGLDQYAPLDPALRSIGRVFPCLFPPRGELWSCSRPCSTSPNRCRQNNRIPTGPLSTSP